MLLDLTVPLLGRIAPYGPVERTIEYVQNNDLTSELCRALRDFQANLREEMSISQATIQSLRQQLNILLWLDEWEPLDPAHCWSECIRRDLRLFVGERRVLLTLRTNPSSTMRLPRAQVCRPSSKN
jgi:site-specific recombinase XerC